MWLQQESKARVVMQCAAFAAGIVSMLSLTAALLIFIHTANKVVAQVPEQVNTIRWDVNTQLNDARQQINQQLDAARTALVDTTNHQVGGLRVDLRKELDAYRDVADVRVGDTLARVDAALADIAAVRAAAVPVLDNAAELTASTKDAAAILLRRDALPAQLLGVTAAAKVALGETAVTMRTVQLAAPEVSESIKKAAAESAKASANTAALTAHLSEETKPLPKWVRVGLSVAPPLAQAGAAVTSIMSLLGIIP